MTDLNIAGSIDALAERVGAIDGILRVYTVTGTSEDDGQLFPIPDSLDSTPVCNLWFRGTTQFLPGNIERITWRVDANVWMSAANAGYGYRVLLPFATSFVTAFRGMDAITLGGVVTKCVIDNIGEPQPQPTNGQPYLVLPITFALLNQYESSDYSA